MVENHTVLLLGWKVQGEDKVREFKKRLDEVDLHWYDKFSGEWFVNDTMMGNYLYFGVILADYDSERDMVGERLITPEYMEHQSNGYRKFLNDNPAIAGVLDMYGPESPKLYLFQHIW